MEYLLWRELRLTCKEEIENLLQVGAVDRRILDAMVDAQQSSGVATKRGCRVENGFQGKAKDAARRGLGSGEGLAGKPACAGVWGGG